MRSAGARSGARTKAGAVVAALFGFAIAWDLLRLGVPIAQGLADGFDGAAAEAVFTLALFAPMLLFAVVAGRIVGTLRFGGGGMARASAGGAAIGGAALLLAIGYCWLAGTLSWGGDPAWSPVLPLGLAVIAVQVLAEEALFRGYAQPLLVRAVGVPGGILLTAAAFAGLHAVVAPADSVVLGNMMLGGILFGCLAAGRGGFTAAGGAHWAWNAGEQIGVGLDPNPGVGAFGALLDLDLVGPVRWGGSADGLNASWALCLAMGAATALVALRMREMPAFAGSEREAVRPA